MPRGPRLDIEGALHHVMVRGIERRKIFLSDEDRTDLVRRIGQIVPKSGAKIYAWSLLPNHFHILIRTGHLPLSSIMRKILTGYAVSFNHRHKRAGHLFQNRYKSILVEEEPYLLELVRYIHLNPVRAKMVEKIDQLDIYAWSGHAALMGKQDNSWQDLDYILARFGHTSGRARKAYRNFVQAGIAQGKRPDLVGGGLVRSAGGWDKAQDLLRGREKWAHDERILGSGEFVNGLLNETEELKLEKHYRIQDSGMDLERLVDEIARRLGLGRAEITRGGRRRKVIEARRIISFLGARRLGLPMAKIASHLNVSKQSISRGAEEGEQILAKKGWVFSDFGL